MTSRQWSVGQLVAYLKNKLDNDYLIQSVWVYGEISNVTAHSSGHCYFTLKDETSRIQCVMFATYAAKLAHALADGMKVLIRANTSIYEKSGQIQLYVLEVQDIGAGLLYRRFEELKGKLEKEGLFATEHKKPLPRYPFRIGVVTGKNTAARYDVITTLTRRWPIAQIVEFNALVQGDGAYLSVIEALSKADVAKTDVIILARGGGSIEDLWAFNEEPLIRFVYNMHTPLITGIGHETDMTLVDFVSDQRAPTPTGAAELATPLLETVKGALSTSRTRLQNSIVQTLQRNRVNVDRLLKSRIFTTPESLIQDQNVNLMMNIKALGHYGTSFSNRRYRIAEYGRKIAMLQKETFTIVRSQITRNCDRMNSAWRERRGSARNSLGSRMALLSAYSPLEVLRRGYSITFHNDDIVRSIEDVEIDDQLNIRLNDGKLKVTVNDKEK